MTTDLINKLIETIKSLSSLVWEAYIKQVQINGIGDFVLAGVLFIISCVTAWSIKKIVNLDDFDKNDEYNVLIVFLIGVFGSIMFCLGLFNLYRGINFIINPEYWVIKLLIETIK